MTIDIDPDIFSIGSHATGWHGVMMVLGIIVAVLLAARLAVKEGISSQAVYTSAFWIVICGLIGARLTHVIDDFDYYRNHLTQIFALWEGGMGWYGGFIGGILAGVVYAKVNKISVGKFADIVGLGVMLGLAIGRIGCTINGDAYGSPTSLPWGLTYTHPDAFADPFVAGHPAPVYEIIWLLAIFAVLWKLRGRLIPPGSLFLVTVALYSFGRFFISWARAEPDVLGPLHQAHIISIVMFVGALAFLAYRGVSWAKPGSAGEVTVQEQNQEH
ncbi:prolipoprotein diacylglyceryl transferase [Chloroflexota bacterium]